MIPCQHRDLTIPDVNADLYILVLWVDGHPDGWLPVAVSPTQ